MQEMRDDAQSGCAVLQEMRDAGQRRQRADRSGGSAAHLSAIFPIAPDRAGVRSLLATAIAIAGHPIATAIAASIISIIAAAAVNGFIASGIRVLTALGQKQKAAVERGRRRCRHPSSGLVLVQSRVGRARA